MHASYVIGRFRNPLSTSSFGIIMIRYGRAVVGKCLHMLSCNGASVLLDMGMCRHRTQGISHLVTLYSL